MRHESLVNEDWTNVVALLGGADALDATARETKAFLRPREITNAVDLLRLILAYCLGERGLRSTAAWATSTGLVDLSQERFGHFELTDQQAGETLDRIPVVAGEIRLGDRAYLQPDRMATVIE